MPLTPRDQQHLDRWFTYHRPSKPDLVRFTALREARKGIDDLLLVNRRRAQTYRPRATFDDISAVCRRFAAAICEHAPPTSDRIEALRCVRMARMGLNELANTPREAPRDYVEILSAQVLCEVNRAHWLANASIALHQPEAADA